MRDPLRPAWRRVRWLAPLAVLALAAGLRADDKPADGKLPPAKDLLARHLQAIGGKEAVLKHKSSHARGKMEIAAQNITGDLEIIAAAPNKMLFKANIPGIGEVRRGYDGKVAWNINPTTGPSLVEGKEAEQIKEGADFHSEVNEAKRFKSLETVEETKFEDKDCYKVKAVSTSGQTSFRFYDKQSGLLVGSTATQTVAGGEQEVTTIYSDYKEFDGIRLATRTVQRLPQLEATVILQSVEFDKVDPKVFELPKEIKALLEK
jgi:hypothetical protein